MNWKEIMQRWTALPGLTEAEKQVLVAQDEETAENAFYKYVSFGTGGMRGLMGPGTNRLNNYTVARLSAALAESLCRNNQKKVVIAYDSRHQSDIFARISANVLAYHGIEVFLSDELRSTPWLSFSVRELKANAGIMITASHNPPEYNGYKIYDEAGGQITPEFADQLVTLMEAMPSEEAYPIADWFRIGLHENVNLVGMELDQAYSEQVGQILRRPQKREQNKELKIVYTPLHGAGYRLVPHILNLYGFEQTYVVPSQAIPDPNFTTVHSPNPESPESFAEAIDYAKKLDAQIIYATDPDADRLGIAVRDADYQFQNITGNQLGVLLFDYLTQFIRTDISKAYMLVETIVTTDMGEKIAKNKGIGVDRTLTGFKYIGEKIGEYEVSSDKQFLFGFEESYGYLALPIVRDKDAIQIVLLASEMAAYYHEQGKNLLDRLAELHTEYGYYLEELETIVLNDDSGLQKVNDFIETLRESRVTTVGNLKVEKWDDYLQQQTYYFDGHTDSINLPKENVLKFYLADGSWFCIRPSGTEPKCKIYYSAMSEDSQSEAIQKLNHLKTNFNKLRQSLNIL